ncbi:MAG: hypothetical protein SFV21_21945 [Rhodospirillaceae bacterium]|nr:hypothetical protein [Rhodospirillaceae bacterium]
MSPASRAFLLVAAVQQMLSEQAKCAFEINMLQGAPAPFYLNLSSFVQGDMKKQLQGTSRYLKTSTNHRREFKFSRRREAHFARH